MTLRRAPAGAGAEIALFHPGGPADYDHALDLIEAGGRAVVARLAAGR